MTREVRQPHAGPDWSELASLERCAAVLDPADEVGAKNDLIDRVHKLALRRALPELEGLRVLDFGCGTGRLSEWLAANGSVVTGVDATPEMVERARALVPAATFQQIDGFALPVADGTMDAIVSAYVLQYYVADDESMEALLAEFRRVLRPEGLVVAIEQATDGDIGRGATTQRYVATFSNADYELLAHKRIRLGDSLVGYHVQRRPVLGRLPFVPRLVLLEAGRREDRPLLGERYADVLFSARA